MVNTKLAMLILLIGIMLTGYGGMCQKDSDSGSSAPVEEFPLGLKLLSNSVYQSIPMAGAPLMGIGDLPAEWDLSSDLPTPGNQLNQGSCVGWAIAYALKTHQERVERSWSLDASNHLFSPAYIYNQINLGRYSGSDSGARFPDAFNILTSQGCATLATMPYHPNSWTDTNDYLTQPSQTARDEASQYKAVLWRTVNYWDSIEVKKWLKSGSALPIAILVGSNFNTTNIRNSNYIYSSLGNKVRDMNGNASYPGHAVTLVGYNDTKSAFKIINSWGTGWGDNGYAWIDYDFFPQVCFEAYYVQDEITGETVSIPNRPSGPTSGNTSTIYSYSTGGSTSSLGHAVEYRFDWKGDGSDLSVWGSSTQSKTWSSVATYSVKAQARCTADTSVVSAWSSGFDVIISASPPAETASTPNQPTGTTSGYTSTSYDYSTGGSSSNLGHSIEYRFDWGDASYSTWSSSNTASKTWFSVGTYTVKAQARCAADTSIVSDWSLGISVSIVAVSSWQISTMESGIAAFYPSIAVDSNNKVHISYFDDNPSYNLKYATNATGSWVYTKLDSTGTVGAYTSIALDPDNYVHISYIDLTNNTLKYATNDAGSWWYTTIDSANYADNYLTSIAVDSNYKVHISYYDGSTNKNLKYATNASGSWVCSIIDSTGDVGRYSSIAVDSNNKVHISYLDVTNYDLKYATNATGSWVCSTLDSTDNVGRYSSIVVDSNNKVHISYYDITNDDLKYATNASGSWVCGTLDDGGRWTSIAVDSNNKVHISYYDITNGALYYVTNASGSWVGSNLDSIGDVGWYTSIAIDSNNKVHISYCEDAPNFDLKYATNKN